MRRATILILDNGPRENEDYLYRWLTQEGHTVVRAGEKEAMAGQAFGPACDLLIVHDRLLVKESAAVSRVLQWIDSRGPAIAFGKPDTVAQVRQILQTGVTEYLFEPVEKDIVIAAVERALSENRVEPAKAPETEVSRPILAQSGKMRNLLEIAKKIAFSDATVLIAGESGTGKELLARFIHHHSPRASRVFVGMNCAALPENLAESELFGYEKGAFTGAFKRTPGKFESAHQGTLLLDEISEMPPVLQAKLLRVLQEKQISRIGGNEVVHVDARLIATTNRDLVQMVEQGLFREDLYYRLRVIPLTIPPLRDRPEDIPGLANYFLKKFSPGDVSLPKQFDPEAMHGLLRWPWPGNIRELENTIHRAALISSGPVIHQEDLLLEEMHNNADRNEDSTLVGRTVKEVEKTLIEQTLAHVHFNRTHAARILGISIRTLRNKLNEFQNDAAAMAGS